MRERERENDGESENESEQGSEDANVRVNKGEEEGGFQFNQGGHVSCQNFWGMPSVQYIPVRRLRLAAKTRELPFPTAKPAISG